MDENNNLNSLGNDPSPQPLDDFGAWRDPDFSSFEPIASQTPAEEPPVSAQPETYQVSNTSPDAVPVGTYRPTAYPNASMPPAQFPSSGPPYAPAYQPPKSMAPPPSPPKKSNAGKIIIALLLVLVVAAGSVIGVGIYRYTRSPSTSDPTVNSADANLTMQPTPSGLAATPAADGALSPPQIYEKLKNTNVAILVYSSSQRGDSLAGEGSGVLIHEDSSKTYTYVVTCAHVVEGATNVSVELEDGATIDAILVGSDPRTDVAVLKIKKTGLPAAEFGNSDDLNVGESVYAIGNPGGTEFKGSFTPGMVSAIDRPIQSKYKMITIQHTAAINPGNSGGALLNAAGQVIGINSLKIVDAEYEGMGFAIPSKTVVSVVNSLIAKGYVPNRPKLGIQYKAANETQQGFFVLRANSLPSGSLIIYSIDPGSSFAGTDVKAYDIITHVNGKPLTKSNVLLEAIDNSKVGDKLTLSICRVSADYEITKFDVTVTLVEDKGSTEEPTTSTPNWDPFNDFMY
ncbi:MAG: trypsin-like peptidase domain-containing protein [Oscillospiraceae bacterium]|jgi:serine protease Do|nr:trypsin-like peptidase domain-containing protein [Oscillospiraceae bacterium]